MTPIETLIKMSEKPHRNSVLDPPPNECEPVGTREVLRFEDLLLNQRVLVWDYRDARWRSGVVTRTRTIAARDPVRGAFEKIQTTVHTTGPTFFFYDHTWGRSRTRVRAMPPDGVVGPQTAADTWPSPAPFTAAQARREPRQAAKSMNFGSLGVRGQAHLDWVWETYAKIQREEIAPYKLLATGVKQFVLTPDEISYCQTRWSEGVAMKVYAIETEDQRREREQVVCDDDRWEV